MGSRDVFAHNHTIMAVLSAVANILEGLVCYSVFLEALCDQSRTHTKSICYTFSNYTDSSVLLFLNPIFSRCFAIIYIARRAKIDNLQFCLNVQPEYRKSVIFDLLFLKPGTVQSTSFPLYLTPRLSAQGFTSFAAYRLSALHHAWKFDVLRKMKI